MDLREGLESVLPGLVELKVGEIISTVILPNRRDRPRRCLGKKLVYRIS